MIIFAKRTAFFESNSAAADCGSGDDQRRRLAAKAKNVGRKLLAEVATIVTPETLLAWRRRERRHGEQYYASD